MSEQVVMGSEWHRRAVGGLWEEIGRLQFDFLIAHGLKPEHYLLDVGCGSLRGGVHFIGYLESGHYFGVDQNEELLEAGRNIELVQNGLVDRGATLVQMDNFDFSVLPQKFDYALAQSLFTHLSINSIIRCIVNLEQALASGGKFFASFFESPQGQFSLQPLMHPRPDGPARASYLDRDPYHYGFDVFKWICASTQLQVDYIGEWGHPRDIKMLVITKP